MKQLGTGGRIQWLVAGLILLVLALGCALLLILDMVAGLGIATSVSAAVTLWLMMMWFIYPLWIRHRDRACRVEAKR